MQLQSLLTTRFAELDGDLRRTFDELQGRVQRLHESIEKDVTQHLSACALPDDTDADPEPEKEKDLLAEWILKDKELVVEEGKETLTISALVLQQSALALQGASGQSHLRLNSRMMELSMKTDGAVEALGRQRIRNNLQPTARRFSGIYAEHLRRRCQPPTFKPNAKARVTWDLMGMILILIDAFLLPSSIAWDIDITPFGDYQTTGMRMLQVFAAVSLVFWPMDILVSFNTAFYVGAALETHRVAIAVRYLCTWFPFDISVVVLDFSLALSSTSEEIGGVLQPLRSARYLRILRSLRIIRLLKAGKINVMLENFLISLGRQWLILTFTVGRMLITILMVAHMLACTWFALGQAVSAGGQASWIDLAGIRDLPEPVQYIHSMQWIIMPPAPPPLSPDSGMERFTILMTVVVVVLVIGTSLSLLTTTLQEIRQVNNERSRKRRELRIFLETRAAPTELVMKVMSYADFKMARNSPIAFDETLISPKLKAELATFQRGSYLMEHPIFWLVGTVFPLVFNDLCLVLEKQLFCEGEAVFRLGEVAEMMYISSHGDFRICTDAQATKKFSGAHYYFAEVALYVEAAMHDCTLLAQSFAEVFVLTGERLAAVLANTPVCAAMYIEYANEFISHYSVLSPDAEVSDVIDAHLRNSENACESNSFYLEMYVDERKQLSLLNLAALRGESGVPSFYRKSESASSVGSDLVVRTSTKSFTRRSGQSKTSASPQERTEHISPKAFVASIFETGKEGRAASELVADLRDAFVELDPGEGLHARFSDTKEQERAESAILSLIALVRGDYEAYTAPQKPAARLTMEQWQQLQGVVTWSAPDQEKLLAAIFLLAVRGIGKCRSLTHQLPLTHQRPDQAVLYVLDHYPDAVPSMYSLGSDVRDLVGDTLELQHDFIFAQMLQGENVPANLLQLQQFIDARRGEETLKFYVLFLLGFLSGLAGGQGSRFMTYSNAKATILGLSTMRKVLVEDPVALYWTYIHSRGLQLGRNAKHTQDLAVLRLACLCRAQADQDLSELQTAWDVLSAAERKELTKHFLADGIHNRAFVLEFLPLCLERAKKNPFVTIPTLLEVLVELLRAVRAAASHKGQTVFVDLADMAAFILMVQNGFVFQTCLCRSKLQVKGSRFYLEMTQDNWRRVSEAHTDVVMLASSVRELVKTTKREEEEKHDEQSSSPPLEAVMSCCF